MWKHYLPFVLSTRAVNLPTQSIMKSRICSLPASASICCCSYFHLCTAKTDKSNFLVLVPFNKNVILCDDKRRSKRLKRRWLNKISKPLFWKQRLKPFLSVKLSKKDHVSRNSFLWRKEFVTFENNTLHPLSKVLHAHQTPSDVIRVLSL